MLMCVWQLINPGITTLPVHQLRLRILRADALIISDGSNLLAGNDDARVAQHLPLGVHGYDSRVFNYQVCGHSISNVIILVLLITSLKYPIHYCL
jgi:hypothetical protein